MLDSPAGASFHGCALDPDTPADAGISRQRLLAMLEVLAPRPSQHPLIRLGGDGDGAYLFPDDLEGIAACFSPGVNNAKRFEDDLVDRYGIPCHMCDRSSDADRLATPLRQGKQSFMKLWLEPRTTAETISLQDWVAQCSPDGAGDLMLQMDIEGAEYRNLLDAPDALLRRFRILIIEFHDLHRIAEPAVFRAVFEPLLERLGRDFQCVHAHPNNCAGDVLLSGIPHNIPRIHELTFLRRDRIRQPQGETHSQIPHPLDIVGNVSHLPPLFLNDHWLARPRSRISRAKMLEDELLFVKPGSAYAGKALAYSYGVGQRLARRGHAMRPDADTRDVAAGKPFLLSSAYGRMPRSGLVQAHPKFFFHTDFGRFESISIDLGEPFEIQDVVVHNRGDGWRHRAQYLYCALHADRSFDPENAFPLIGGEDAEAAVMRYAAPPGPARYVTFFSPLHTALHFSKVEILAAA